MPTNPTISADERVQECKAENYDELWAAYEAQQQYIEQLEWRLDNAPTAEQICQAEQAAYERAAQYIADKEERGESPVIAACASFWAAELRALAQEPEKVEIDA